MGRRVRTRVLRSLRLVLPVLAVSVLVAGGTADATPAPVNLGTATTFAILGGNGVTNVGAGTSVTGNLTNQGGGAQITGPTCAQVNGSVYAIDAAGPAPCSQDNPGFVATVTNDARAAFNATTILPPTTVLGSDLGGMNLISGIYSFTAAATNLPVATPTLTLNAQSDPNAVWIFQGTSSLVTDAATAVQFANLPAGETTAQAACNVFWTIGNVGTAGAATLGAGSTFLGTLMTHDSISVNAGTNVTGRLLAGMQASGTGLISLNTDTITTPSCGTFHPAAPAGPSTAVPAFTG
jgi:hypothetical protein